MSDGFLLFEVYDVEMGEIDNKEYSIEIEGLRLEVYNGKLIRIEALYAYYVYDEILDTTNCLSKLLRKGMIEILWVAENVIDSKRIVVEPNKVIEYTLDWKEKNS